jgi:hypothetical protein
MKMKKHIITTSVLLAAFLVVLGIAVMGTFVSAHAGTQGDPKLFGKTYGEWSAEWWQWAMSIPAESNPLQEGDCDQNQIGPVWYLAGNLGDVVGTEMRDCTVPRGKSIFFPLVNAIFFNAPEESFEVEQKRFILDALFNEREPTINSRACELSATLDGYPAVYNFPIVRTQSPPFRIEFIEDNIFEVDPPGWVDEEVVSDGFWVMLPPLTAGAHELHFTGFLCDDEGAPVLFPEVVDVTYHITVSPGGR